MLGFRIEIYAENGCSPIFWIVSYVMFGFLVDFQDDDISIGMVYSV